MESGREMERAVHLNPRRPWTGVARIEMHAGGDTPEKTLTVRLSRFDPTLDTWPEPSAELLSTYLFAVHGGPYSDNVAQFLRASQSSVTVAKWLDADEVPNLVVDRLMTQLPGAKAVGALMDDRTCRVGLRTRELPWDGDHGMLLTMVSEEAEAPVELFPCLLLGWSYWWQKREKDLRGRPVSSKDLPPPPAHLDLVENGRSFRVRLEGWERTEWPEPPPRQRDHMPNVWLDPDSG